MRIYFAILITVLFLNTNLSLAQDLANKGSQAGFTRVSKKDMLSRAAMAKLEFNEPFIDPKAETFRRLLVKTHVNSLPYPTLDFKDISGEDTVRLEKIKKSMEEARQNPPSWEEIYKMELKQVEEERKKVER